MESQKEYHSHFAIKKKAEKNLLIHNFSRTRERFEVTEQPSVLKPKEKTCALAYLEKTASRWEWAEFTQGGGVHWQDCECQEDHRNWGSLQHLEGFSCMYLSRCSQKRLESPWKVPLMVQTRRKGTATAMRGAGTTLRPWPPLSLLNKILPLWEERKTAHFTQGIGGNLLLLGKRFF